MKASTYSMRNPERLNCFQQIALHLGGMAQAGQLRALTNLSLPLEQSYTALSILFLPYAARVCREKGISSS